MALANFFDKTSLGISRILNRYDRKDLEAILSSQTIIIFFDENASETTEGRTTLDLLIRLVARLYPKIQIKSNHQNELTDSLKELAVSINPAIEIPELEEPSICIIVGKTTYPGKIPTFYIGSDNWVTHFSANRPVGSLNSNNPFGAGASACIGSANLFRWVFKNHLPYSHIDTDFSLSLLDFSLSPGSDDLLIDSVHLDETLLVGLGAIGNGVVWALQRLKGVSGKLVVIDNEHIALSNLQRYALTDQESIDLPKTALCEMKLQGTKLTVVPQTVTWEEYINSRNGWEVETVLTCIDNAEGRILIQGALPKKIFNGWTQRENLGVSRHTDFIKTPCLCCLYFPTTPKPSQSQEIADNLNLSTNEKVIRDYLANQKPVDEALLNLIATTNKIDAEEFKKFIGKSLTVFYSEVVCGGVLMRINESLNRKNDQSIDVPSAFESALAGILLAAELVKDKLGYSMDDLPTTTQFNLIRPISKYLNTPEVKNPACICNDIFFQDRYKSKWLNN